MPPTTDPLKFKLGARVKLLSQSGRIGRVAEYRGPLSPGKKNVYRVLIRKKPRGYVEVLEDQMEAVPTSH